MANHTLFLLNNRKRKTEKQIHQLRCQLFCNKSIRTGIEAHLTGLKAARQTADREGHFEAVGDIALTVNLFRDELQRQMVARKQIIDSLEAFGASLLNVQGRIKEELANVIEA